LKFLNAMLLIFKKKLAAASIKWSVATCCMAKAFNPDT
jgi:hypothetical protein